VARAIVFVRQAPESILKRNLLVQIKYTRNKKFRKALNNIRFSPSLASRPATHQARPADWHCQ
jgi:hypothetical protein